MRSDLISVKLFIVVSILVLAGFLSPINVYAYDCKQLNSSFWDDEGDDGCFAWCKLGESEYCSGASWYAFYLEWSCEPDPEPCATPCTIESKQNKIIEECYCDIDCIVEQEQWHEYLGSWVHCNVCP